MYEAADGKQQGKMMLQAFQKAISGVDAQYGDAEDRQLDRMNRRIDQAASDLSDLKKSAHRLQQDGEKLLKRVLAEKALEEQRQSATS